MQFWRTISHCSISRFTNNKPLRKSLLFLFCFIHCIDFIVLLRALKIVTNIFSHKYLTHSFFILGTLVMVSLYKVRTYLLPKNIKIPKSKYWEPTSYFMEVGNFNMTWWLITNIGYTNHVKKNFYSRFYFSFKQNLYFKILGHINAIKTKNLCLTTPHHQRYRFISLALFDVFTSSWTRLL
jgi:hypothetical protein